MDEPAQLTRAEFLSAYGKPFATLPDVTRAALLAILSRWKVERAKRGVDEGFSPIDYAEEFLP